MPSTDRDQILFLHKMGLPPRQIAGRLNGRSLEAIKAIIKRDRQPKSVRQKIPASVHDAFAREAAIRGVDTASLINEVLAVTASDGLFTAILGPAMREAA